MKRFKNHYQHIHRRLYEEHPSWELAQTHQQHCQVDLNQPPPGFSSPAGLFSPHHRTPHPPNADVTLIQQHHYSATIWEDLLFQSSNDKIIEIDSLSLRIQVRPRSRSRSRERRARSGDRNEARKSNRSRDRDGLRRRSRSRSSSRNIRVRPRYRSRDQEIERDRLEREEQRDRKRQGEKKESLRVSSTTLKVGSLKKLVQQEEPSKRSRSRDRNGVLKRKRSRSRSSSPNIRVRPRYRSRDKERDRLEREEQPDRKRRDEKKVSLRVSSTTLKVDPVKKLVQQEEPSKRSRSRDGNGVPRRSRSRSSSRNTRARPRLYSQDQEMEREHLERKKERDRKRRGLPSIKKESLSVCSTTLLVSHLSKLVQQEELLDTFGQYGEILWINLIPQQTCAFICMHRRQDAYRALTKLDGHKLRGKSIALAWTPGKGVKAEKWKIFWEVNQGVSYVPWHRLIRMTDLEALEEGGSFDEETLPPHRRGLSWNNQPSDLQSDLFWIDTLCVRFENLQIGVLGAKTPESFGSPLCLNCSSGCHTLHLCPQAKVWSVIQKNIAA